MGKEWSQTCKDCGKTFGYSDYALQSDSKRGFSRPERCPDCRKQHGLEIESIANSHFHLIPRKSKRSILGEPYLGMVDHGERVLEEKENKPDVSGMDIGMTELHMKKVYEALQEFQVLVIVAPTGTGKSTYIPFRLLEPLKGYSSDAFTQHGPIVVTQPRVPAASGIPYAIGNKLLGSSIGPGYEIGYRHGDKSGQRKGEVFDRRNRLLFVTDGSLLNWIAEGKIGEFSIIIIDEAHERSKNIDLILGLVKNELLKYPHLKLIVASATIDAESFINYYAEVSSTKLLDFSDCQKSYGYTEYPWKWSELSEQELTVVQTDELQKEAEQFQKTYEKGISKKVAEKVLELLEKTSNGGILGFLHGKGEIEECIEYILEAVKHRKDIRVFPLYTEVGKKRIDNACGEFKDSDKMRVRGKLIMPRRIVIATNIAETSLTIRDVVYVVDSGLIKQSEWNSETCRQELRTRFHSKDGCKQRWGRAGRVQKGYVHKLYSKEQFIKYFPQHTSPEIERECLDDVVLKAKASGVEDIDPSNFSWLQAPKQEELNRAVTVFNERRLIDEDNDLTAEGREVYRLANRVGRFLADYDPISTNRAIDVATLLLKADKFACLIEAVTALAMMPHMGTSLYVNESQKNNYEGLLLWNKKWDLRSKDYIGRLHNELYMGCVDDLDFACKLFALYEGKINGIPESILKDWGERYFINIGNFDLIAKARGEFLDVFTQGKKTELLRPIDFSLIERVRLLISIVWSDRIVELNQKGKHLMFENPLTKTAGLLSEYSAGSWTKGNKAVIGMMDQSDIVIGEEKKGVPILSFLIKAPGKIPSKDTTDSEIVAHIIKIREGFDMALKARELFSHLYAPAGSQVNISPNSKSIDSSKVALPDLFKASFEKTSNSQDEVFDSAGLYDHDIKRTRIDKDTKKHKYGNFGREHFVIDSNILCKLSGKKKVNIGNVVKWKMEGNNPVAIVGSIFEKEFITNKSCTVKQTGNLKLKLSRPIFDKQPDKIVGYIGEDEEGNLLPLTSLNLSIEQHNPGLCKYDGQTFVFKNFKENKFPDTFGVTILPVLEKDLYELIDQEVVEGEVEKITVEKIHFSFSGKNSFLHSTDLALNLGFVTEILKHLPLGEKVRLEIKPRFSKDDVLRCTVEEDKRLSRDDFQILKSIGIEVKDSQLNIKRPLKYQELLKLQNQIPDLVGELRGLYSVSNHITISGVEISKVYNHLKKEILSIRAEATTSGNSAKEKIKKFQEKINKDHKLLLRKSVKELRNHSNIAWQLSDLSYLRTKLQNQRAYLLEVEGQIATARTSDFRFKRELKKKEVLNDIRQIESKIHTIESLVN